MSTSRHKGMGRREFLRTSTCALATAAVGPQLFAGFASPKLMVAGFAPLEIESAGTDVFTANVIDARRASADAAFLRHNARISAYGLSGSNAEPRALDFLTHYAIGRGESRHVVPFHTWVSSRRAEGPRPVSFTVPVDEEQKIRFSMTAKMPVVKPAASSSRRGLLSRPATTSVEPRALPIELSLHGDAGSTALSRGFYVVVPVYEGQRTPDWSAYTLRRSGGRWALHERYGSELRPAGFEHFVLRVDYARPKESKRA